VDILANSPNEPAKNAIDSRYLWPILIFENVCECSGNFGGANGDCSECDFGWIGANCNVKKPPVIRKKFSSLTSEEKRKVVNATRDLKHETGYWSVIVDEPNNYTSGTVQLQNVSTYDSFIVLHGFIARDDSCNLINKNVNIDFAHKGPVFPLWHRRYILIVEREFQRILQNESFGLPYWQWEVNDMSPFHEDYFGSLPHHQHTNYNRSKSIINPYIWNTLCDLNYQNESLSCSDYWKACNPAEDLAKKQMLQRDGARSGVYLPNVNEVKIALATNSYSAPDINGQYNTLYPPRSSFSNRLEGWNRVCSALPCVSPSLTPIDQVHMHNVIHVWIGGHMLYIPAAVNDPIFNLHHCNVDRMLESQELLPAYAPISNGHPGHNRDDYIVPFFPLITPGKQYQLSKRWGYVYDELIPADTMDYDIPTCDVNSTCAFCDANGTCINCFNIDYMCPLPNVLVSPQGDVGKLDILIWLGIIALSFISTCCLLLIIMFIIHIKLTCTIVSSGF
jgi:tyrosinase